MTIPDAAIEAAAEARTGHYYTSTKNLGRYRTSVTCSCGVTLWWGQHDGDPHRNAVWQGHLATAALEAAEPAFREAIAQEIEDEAASGRWSGHWTNGLLHAAGIARAAVGIVRGGDA